MTPEELILALEVAAHGVILRPEPEEPAACLTWLALQGYLLVPHDVSMMNRFYSGSGWAGSLLRIGRGGQSTLPSCGAPHGLRSFIIQVAGQPEREFQLEIDSPDRVLQAMIVLEH